MSISEERLREIVVRVLRELENVSSPSQIRQKIYMVGTSQWDEGYLDFLRELNDFAHIQVCPVIPDNWKQEGYDLMLSKEPSCGDIVVRSAMYPADLASAVTVFPVVPRDLIVKAALCISDTFENRWITSCIEQGSRIVLLSSGLKKFSGNESGAYVTRILDYYRMVLEYGIEIGDLSLLLQCSTTEPPKATRVPAIKNEKTQKQIQHGKGKKRVIAASNVDQYASNGVLYVSQNDIVTDLAKDRAKFLNITIKN